MRRIALITELEYPFSASADDGIPYRSRVQRAAAVMHGRGPTGRGCLSSVRQKQSNMQQGATAAKPFRKAARLEFSGALNLPRIGSTALSRCLALSRAASSWLSRIAKLS